MTRSLTAAHGERMRRTALALTLAAPLAALVPVDGIRQSGVVGVLRTDYYIVPDDDPRLLGEPTPDPRGGA